MKLRVNGEEQEVAAGATVTDLLETLGLSAKRVAIERNRVIVTQEQWAQLALESGDELEIVLTRQRSATDVELSVEVSGDLEFWTSGEVELVSVLNNGATETLVLRVRNLASFPQLFLRSKAVVRYSG